MRIWCKNAECASKNLNKVIEDAKAFRIFAGLHINERSDLRRGERDVLIPHHNLQLLPPNPVRLGPVVIIFLHYLYPSQIKEHLPSNYSINKQANKINFHSTLIPKKKKKNSGSPRFTIKPAKP